MPVRKMAHGPAAIVRGHGQVISFCAVRYFLGFGKTAAPGQVEHHDTGRAIFKQLAEAPSGDEPLAYAERLPAFLSESCVGREIVLRQNFLEPHHLVRFQGFGDLNRARQIPIAVKFHGDLHRIAQRIADFAHRLQAGFDFAPRDIDWP